MNHRRGTDNVPSSITDRCSLFIVHFSFLILTCLVALVLRVHRLAEPLMRWDEGWSVAHASRSWLEVAPGADFGGVIRLDAAQYSAQAGPGGEVGVALQWHALQEPLPDCRVVLQIWDETGEVLA